MQSDLRNGKTSGRTSGTSGKVIDPGPDIIPFDATDDDAFVLPNLSLSSLGFGLSGVEMATEMATRSSVVIEAPNGPMRIATGYFVYAVIMDSQGIAMGQRIGDGGLRFAVASELAAAVAARRPDIVPFDATHVIVNDGVGETIEKHEMRRVAA